MGKNKTKKRTRRPNKGWLAGSSATQTICISFLLVIAVGTLLLTLPISSTVSYTHLTLPTKA